MPDFYLSETSEEKLGTCVVGIQKVIRAAIKNTPVDFAVTCGHRDEADQNLAYREGFSKLKYPESRHNKIPSEAVDIVPYVDGKPCWEEKYFYIIAGVILSEAARLGIKLTWGGFWKNFRDLPHFQLKRNGSYKKEKCDD